MPDRAGRIYSATYSNVPVYEFNVGGNHVMRRRSDDWINATHILKVADYDKPARTRILEREVQKGVHEKVQGGYGKYQGTWVPLAEGRLLAERNGILDKLAPIFDFTPGDRSPPPAPKHATAASSRPKAPRPSAPARRAPAPQQNHVNEMAAYDNFSVQQSNETPDNGSLISETEEEMYARDAQLTGSRKRKRDGAMSYEEQQHVMWSDDLLDYFMLLDSEDASPDPPIPDPCINVNRPIDDKGHSAMHWAAAMGDLNVVRDLIRRGASIDSTATNGETPLIRSILFTNNFDKQTFGKLIHILQSTVASADWFGSTVFHHIAMTTKSKSKYTCARYYLDTLMNKLSETWAPQQLTQILDAQDRNGDTAITLAARHGARRCVRSLLFRGAAVDIPNHNNETADELIRALNNRRRDRYRHASSSPFQPPNGAASGFASGPLHHQSSSSNPHLAMFPGSQNLDQPLSFRSEAAHLLSSQLPHLITSRASALATALEAELADRESESQEVERHLVQRRTGLANLTKQSAVLAAKDADAAADAAQKYALDALKAESERLLDLEQEAELASLVRTEESRDDATVAAIDNAPATRLALAQALHAAQQQRRALVAAVVAAHSSAGMSDRQALYKRLITGALGIPPADVAALLPEILADLEESREGGAAAAAAGGEPGDGAAVASSFGRSNGVGAHHDAMDVDTAGLGEGSVSTPTHARMVGVNGAGTGGGNGSGSGSGAAALGMGRAVPDAVGVVG